MASPRDANRVTRQIGRETSGQVGQTWLHISNHLAPPSPVVLRAGNWPGLDAELVAFRVGHHDMALVTAGHNGA